MTGILMAQCASLHRAARARVSTRHSLVVSAEPEAGEELRSFPAYCVKRARLRPSARRMVGATGLLLTDTSIRRGSRSRV